MASYLSSWILRLTSVLLVFFCQASQARDSSPSPVANCQAFTSRRELAIPGFETVQVNVGECGGYCRQGGRVGKLKFRRGRRVFKLRVNNTCECCQVTQLSQLMQPLTPEIRRDERGAVLHAGIPTESLGMVHRRRDSVTGEWRYGALVQVVGGCGCAICNDTIKPRVPLGDEVPSNPSSAEQQYQQQTRPSTEAQWEAPSFFPPGER